MAVIYDVTPKQFAFMKADADEVLFGGAAGGGKSHAQLLDSLCFGVKFPQSRQLLLRRSFPELERSLIPASLKLFPASSCRYITTHHRWELFNRSSIEFGHCNDENDVTRYQSAEYDVIRFDELTHFTEFQYLYLLSRIRGANGFPKQLKSTTNPGGVGHDWVKRRFIDPRPPLEKGSLGGRSLLFIPAKVTENSFLMAHDSGYLKRLEALPDSQRRALLEGDWNVFEGRFFPEFDREIHVTKGFTPPSHWRKYISLDYGLDMLACYWTAFDTQNRGVVYRELYESELIVSKAAEKILTLTPKEERIEQRFAPPDLWGRTADTGKSQAELFCESGLPLTRVSAARDAGWLNLREWLKPYSDEGGRLTAGLTISEGCVNLIRSLGTIQYSKHNPNDCATSPHECTHAPDSLRYLLAGRPCGEDNAVAQEDYGSFLSFGR